ncbi:DUF4363 family protein [bacterium 210820-DFI.6.37]|nr:DUF4363 family protein [bacterium 210820-DFI.6.37]
MRNFVISLLCMGLLIGIWAFFDSYSNSKIDSYKEELETNIIKTVELGDWDKASHDFDDLSQDWHQYKKRAEFFLDTQTINDVDYSIAKAKYYIKAQDVSNSSGELSCLEEQLTFLHYNESLAPGNIF